MRILGLDAAFARCSVAVIEDGVLRAERSIIAARGQSAALARLLADILAETKAPIDLVAVMTGPGGFTGLRAAIALAQGFALGAKAAITGVTLAETLAEAAPADAMRGTFWVALTNRLGGVFVQGLDGTGGVYAPENLPTPALPLTLAGDAEAEVAAILAARGLAIRRSGLREPEARLVARAAWRRARAGFPPHPAQPVYATPPAAIASATRPPPA